jgi:hypothetical protein
MRMRVIFSGVSNLPHIPLRIWPGGARCSTPRRVQADMRYDMNVAAEWVAFRTGNVPGSYLNQETSYPD